MVLRLLAVTTASVLLALGTGCSGSCKDASCGGDGAGGIDAGGSGGSAGSAGEGGGGSGGSGGRGGTGGEAGGGGSGGKGGTGGEGGSGGMPCTSHGCDDVHATCGTIDDGCGHPLSCGTCDDGSSCDSSNTCVCNTTCADVGVECGPHPRCPIDCGTCGVGTCGGTGTPGVCGTSDVPYQPMPDGAEAYDCTGGLPCPAAHLPPSYIVGKDIVMDRWTGLVWQRAISRRPQTQSQASDTCAGLMAGEHIAFRIPSFRELTTIMTRKGPHQAFDGSVFTNTSGELDTLYVTADRDASGDVVQVTGNGGDQAAPSSDTAYVRCVTGTRKPPAVRFDISAEEVVDHQTGLTWARNSSDLLQVAGAQAFCEASMAGGDTGWRLPTGKELETLVAVRTIPGGDGAGIDTGTFLLAVQDDGNGDPVCIWSQSRFPPDGQSQVWTIDRGGWVVPRGFGDGCVTLCVR